MRAVLVIAMADFSSRKVTVTRHEWFVPVGSNHVEFLKAYNAAQAAYRTYNAFPQTYELSDDALWVTSDGEEIVIYFITEEAA